MAWVKWENLVKAIAGAKRDAKGKLITPIKVWANVVLPTGKKQAQEITLRPLLVSSLQSYCNGSSYEAGKNPKIRFYKR